MHAIKQWLSGSHLRPVRRCRFTAAAVILLTRFAACRSYEESTLSVAAPFFKGRVSRINGASVVHLEVAPGLRLQEAVDTTGFVRLRPGMTLEQASGQRGRPTRVETDAFGEEWFIWSLLIMEAKVGCRFGCSGETPKQCRWSLEGVIPNAEAILTPPTMEALESARRILPSTRIELVVTAAGESIDFDLVPNSMVSWTDPRNAATRAGAPRIGECP